jgi:hypothetical protein
MLRTFIMLGLLFGVSVSVWGQEVPKAELFGGYSYAGGNFHGWDTSLTGNLNKWFGVTANFSGHYGQEQNPIFLEHQRALMYLGGPRFTLRRGRRLSPFAYALFGVINYRVKATAGGRTLGSASDTGFNMALGGGLDVTVNDRFAIRAFQLDYLRPTFFGETHNRGRLAFGVVFKVGKK